MPDAWFYSSPTLLSDKTITYLTDVSLLTCVVQSDLSKVILKAARDVGATVGAISHHARGIGVRERLGILGIAVEAEFDILLGCQLSFFRQEFIMSRLESSMYLGIEHHCILFQKLYCLE